MLWHIAQIEVRDILYDILLAYGLHRTGSNKKRTRYQSPHPGLDLARNNHPYVSPADCCPLFMSPFFLTSNSPKSPEIDPDLKHDSLDFSFLRHVVIFTAHKK